MDRQKIALSFLIGLQFILVAVNLHVRDILSTQGEKYQILETEIKQTQYKNNILHQEILKYSSLIYVQEQAKKQSFIEGVYYVLE